ncbi:hypothetical protein ACHAPT_010284 [Fusarium lateritium]
MPTSSTVGPSAMGDESTEVCYFFVDDSNIWIKAQKFAASGHSHMPKLEDSDSDPRLRIDIGSLINTLRNNRERGPSFLYGSRPPPSDSVWGAFEKLKFETKIYERARGKEKEVDHSMAADLAYHAAKLEDKPEKHDITFVVISGDRDMLPPIKIVLKCGIQVEVWAWKSGVSRGFLKLKADEPLLSVKCLDDVFEGENLEKFVSGQLLQLGRLFYTTLSGTEKELFVEFPKVKNMDLTFKRVRELFKDMMIESWVEYNGRSKEGPSVMFETRNGYAPLTDENGQVSVNDAEEDEDEPTQRNPTPTSAAAETEGGREETEQVQGPISSDEEDGWNTVQRSKLNQGHRRAMRQTQQCPRGARCGKRGDCGYQHTERERNLFRDNPTANFTLWKTRKCNRDNCRRGERCAFAHSGEEAWCLRCTSLGHYSTECEFQGAGRM